MLRTTLFKVKQVCALGHLPHLWWGDARCAPSKFEKLSNGCLVQYKYISSVSKDEDQYARCQRIIELAFGPEMTGIEKEIDRIKSDRKEIQSDIIDIHKENLAAMMSSDISCKECTKIINEVFSSDNTKQSIKNDIPYESIANTVVTSTTAKETEEKLAQKIEIIDETALVEAYNTKIEGFNTTPKVLGDKEMLMFHKDIVDNSFKQIKKINVLDELAKRCLDSPANKIDDHLVKEMVRLGIAQASHKDYRLVEKVQKDYMTWNTKKNRIELPNIDTDRTQTIISDHTLRKSEKNISSATYIKEAKPTAANFNQIELDPNNLLVDPGNKRTLECERDDCNEVHNISCYERTGDDVHILPFTKTPTLISNECIEPVVAAETSRLVKIETYTTPETPEFIAANGTAYSNENQPIEQHSDEIESETVVNPLLNNETTTNYSYMDMQAIVENYSKLNVKTQEVLKPELPYINNTNEIVSMSQLLRNRERNYLESCREYIADVESSAVDSVLGSCGKPLTRTPSSPVKPLPPPICRPKPKPNSKPCDQPGKKNPCAKVKKQERSITDTVGLIFAIGPQTGVSYVHSIAVWNNEFIEKFMVSLKGLLVKEAITRFHILSKSFVLFRQRRKDNLLETHEARNKFDGDISHNTKCAKDYEPWCPIPSWPIPVKESKKKLVCPKDGCKNPPPRLNPPTQDNPCLGLPKLSNAVLVKSKSTTSDSREEEKSEYAKCKRIIELAFGKIKDTEKENKILKPDIKDVEPDAKNVHQETQTVLSAIPNKDVQDLNNNKEPFKEDISHTANVMVATTAKQMEEELAQKVEIIDETQLVKASKPTCDGFNIDPKVHGENDGEKVDSSYWKSKNRNVLDELAKRCLDSPTNKIDIHLLKEIERLSKDYSGDTRDQIVQNDVMKRSQRTACKNQELEVVENSGVNSTQVDEFGFSHLGSHFENVSKSNNNNNHRYHDMLKNKEQLQCTEQQFKKRNSFYDSCTQDEDAKLEHQSENKGGLNNNLSYITPHLLSKKANATPVNTVSEKSDQLYLKENLYSEPGVVYTEKTAFKPENIMAEFSEERKPPHLLTDLPILSRTIKAELENDNTLLKPTYPLFRSEWIQTVQEQESPEDEVPREFYIQYVPSALIRDYIACDYEDIKKSNKIYHNLKSDLYSVIQLDSLEDQTSILEDCRWHKESDTLTLTDKNIITQSESANNDLERDKLLLMNAQTARSQIITSDQPDTPFTSAEFDIQETNVKPTVINEDTNKELPDSYSKRAQCLPCEKDACVEACSFRSSEKIGNDTETPILTVSDASQPTITAETISLGKKEINETSENKQKGYNNETRSAQELYSNVIQPEAVVNSLLGKGTAMNYSNVNVQRTIKNCRNQNVDLQNALKLLLSKLNNETEKVSMAELLSKIRKRNHVESCSEYIGAKTDQVVGSCGKNIPPCPPPAPICPPVKAPPCPKPEPPCPKPCPPKCPEPCPPAKEKTDPCSPKRPDPCPPKCPPPRRKNKLCPPKRAPPCKPKSSPKCQPSKKINEPCPPKCAPPCPMPKSSPKCPPAPKQNPCDPCKRFSPFQDIGLIFSM